jgi:serine/threonine-protein kinase
MSGPDPAGGPDLPATLVMLLEQACDRFEEAWQAGRRPRIEDYLEEMPAAGRATLERELRALERAYDWSGHLPPVPPTAWPTEPGGQGLAPPGSVPPPIAGYEILGELGRGGMGVVYRAWQRRLNRAVALKMILAGAHAAPATLARFRTEAEAAARLQHPHIVPIFEVGEHAGMPFAVLELVDGGTLAARLTGTPMPVRQAAELAATLARALDHAHHRGVIHRDLKPGNILLTTDGTPKVADFGLAKLIVGGGASPTQTGEVLGTPSYMAPEQAGSQSGIGPAADLYALGAILYELLTGRPPFKAETPQETIRQVVSAEPVAPSRLRPKLPRDLETICLKCLEKEPARRYSSAAALAEDLRRFLDGEPIRARPVSPPGRAWRWGRRHPVEALSMMAVAALLAAVAIGATVSSRRERQLRHRAEQNLTLARQVVEEMYNQVAEQLENQPGMDSYQRQILEKALRFYDGFALPQSRQPAMRHDAANASLRAGLIRARLGRMETAEAAYRRALTELATLVDENPANSEFRRSLASTFNALGGHCDVTGRHAEAEAAYQQALTLWDRLVRQHPAVAEYRLDQAITYHNLGNLHYRAGRSAETKRAYQRAVEIKEALVRENLRVEKYRLSLASSLQGLGNVYDDAHQAADAERLYRREVALLEELSRDDPGVDKYRSQLADAYHDLAILWSWNGHPDEALRHFGRALEIIERLAQAHPAVVDYREFLALYCTDLGRFQYEIGRREEGLRHLLRAASTYEALVRDHSEVPIFRGNLAWCLSYLGQLYNATGHRDEAGGSFRRALDLNEKLVRDDPGVPWYRSDLSARLVNLGEYQEETGHRAEALGSYRRALDLAEGLVRDHPGDRTYQVRLGLSLIRVGRLQLQPPDPAAEAVRNLHRGRAILERLPGADASELYDAARAYSLCSGPIGRDRSPGEEARRRSDAEQAMALLNRAVAAGYVDAARMRADPDLEPLRSRADFQALLMDLAFPKDPFPR